MISKKITHAEIVKLLFALLLGIVLTACSSSDDSTPATTTINGTVSAPGGAISALERKTFFVEAINFVFPGANAMITGTAPVPNATVELIKLDDSGNQVGGILASAMTDASGNFSITTTENLSSNLVLKVSGSGSAELRALVVSATTDIDPVSEYVLGQIESAIASSTTNTSMSYLSETEIENFLSSIDALNVDLTTMSIANAIAAIGAADSGTLFSAVFDGATLDLSGTWSYVETSGPNSCEDPVGIVVAQETLIITQTGNSITASLPGGQVIATGTISGYSIIDLPLESAQDEGGFWQETSQTFTVEEDGDTVNASISWTWSGGGISCSGTDTAVMTRL